jgi:DMSO/TMAO reductase YedYZ molybdopterin-dependent catalytic subunit
VDSPKSDQSPTFPSIKLTERSEDTWEDSPAAESLERMKANPRIKYIVVVAPDDACPACQNLTGTYPKDQVPRLPIEKCSHPLGCRSYYLPYLDEIFP